MIIDWMGQSPIQLLREEILKRVGTRLEKKNADSRGGILNRYRRRDGSVDYWNRSPSWIVRK